MFNYDIMSLGEKDSKTVDSPMVNSDGFILKENFKIVRFKKILMSECELLTLNEAALWASDYVGKAIKSSNISYLVSYGKIRKYKKNGVVLINKKELQNYYDVNIIAKRKEWEEKLGKVIDWELSLTDYSESERTKHVHRLHSYKGKFIPQLVDYFLNSQQYKLKNEIYFKPGDIVLDPFAGSGTTLVQAKELGIHSLGIDVSEFNCLVMKTKIRKYNIPLLTKELKSVYRQLENWVKSIFSSQIYTEMNEAISSFNQRYFPSPEIKRKMVNKEIIEKDYSQKMVELFFKEYPQYKHPLRTNSGNFKKSNQMNLESFISTSSSHQNLSNMQHSVDNLQLKDSHTFLRLWYTPQIQKELLFFKGLIDLQKSDEIKDLLKVLLSKVSRSCRATTHIDLGSLRDPVLIPYYCVKHKKICSPAMSSLHLFKRYLNDTTKRIQDYDLLQSSAYSEVLQGDSRTIDIDSLLSKQHPDFAQILKEKKIRGIFTSPPYVGQIDYHEQHAYAYELLELERRDEQEIGPMFKGKSQQAKRDYVEGISAVLLNLQKYLHPDAVIFFVANDQHNLYPEIAKRSKLDIIKEFIRPVLHRTEPDSNKYTEKIFLMKFQC